ncbi:Uu.00g011540.m01.CDS01 [Anthostomella pinea]|uniref:Uu.00g011540.m01.CDS01 n=1 Tax=Anthostomella pinea TaxID=933095 RepID=A0AAI8VYP1_9PEZI|nr:Uu.00g011540.m01.CDS01 [Anthostomella pinea]
MRRKAVFQRIKGAELSDDEAMIYAKLRDDMDILITDYLGDAPDSIRDQMMRHDPKFATFHSAYQNHNLQFDSQNAFLEEEKQVQLFKLFAHISISRDPRAVRDMIPEDIWSNLPPDPEISELEALRAELKGGQHRLVSNEHKAKIRQLTYTISLKRTNRDKLIIKKYYKDYFYNGPTRDIERQAWGEEKDEYVKPKLYLNIPKRARLAELLCHQPEHWSQERISEARVEVIDLYAALYKVMH